MAEVDHAREEAQNCKEIRSDIFHFNYMYDTDEARHSQATERAQKATRLLQEEPMAVGAAFRRDAAYADAISKLSRYEIAIERSLYRALHELQRLQAARQNGQGPVPVAVDVTVDGPDQ